MRDIISQIILKGVYMSTTDVLHLEVAKITKISADDQSFLLRYLSRLPLSDRIEAEKRKKKIFHSLREKSSGKDKDLLSYAAHILTIKYMYSKEKRFTSKQFETLSIDEIREVSMIKLRKEDEKEYLKNHGKKHKLLHYWSVVKMYRQRKPKQLSFEKISQLMKKYYNFEVSHNTIAVLWRELEQNQNKQKD
jgi:hypothetical protein